MPDTTEIFDQLFRNARQNAMMILNGEGIVQEVNEAFTTAYGYTTEDLALKHFRILFLDKDQVTLRPEIELNTVHREGSGSDENYLVHKDGTPIWVTGESVLVKTKDGVFIVKMIHNIHAQKQLERYLLSSHELLDSLFESVQQTGLLLLDSQLRTVKTNGAFRRLFALSEKVQKGSRLQEIPHPFWSAEEIKTDVINVLVNHTAINKDYIIAGEDKEGFQRLHIVSKLIHKEASEERQLLLVIKKV
ncbi:MAG: PAS domain S-box protein [Flavisolibacter sp.]|nr:PAS domain S-box protein [Flavisolibacter sp.]